MHRALTNQIDIDTQRVDAMKRTTFILIIFCFLLNPAAVNFAHCATHDSSVAILPFDARGITVKDYGTKIADALFATLATYPDLNLVDRQKLNGILEEYHLNLSGMVDPQQAISIGRLCGAKLLIAGSVNEFDNNLILVAKIISTETSKVLGASTTGRVGDELLPLVQALGEKVAALVQKRYMELVPGESPQSDPIAAINHALGDAVRPSVTVNVAERHVGVRTIDPAAETELTMLLQRTGFKILDQSSPRSRKGDILISGEGFSEFAGRRGDLISVKARLEIKAVDQATGEIIATDRQTGVIVDLSEQIAGKKALEQAAEAIAVRLLPLLVKK